ncbi:hypothetical protein CC1G_03041 [Coprinopsis cinerea okayama7|uniref:ceramidase n=1 Tax=Coprinopsis cinerea (strain Okayama-7 / 130 / ATCC MYA-4618 / FGSC 9003) TaxID=240176 RepID=A8PEP2_COPC7|nr:hypothetical protein CC1G_03041 [Coprinopsis cinerea okayama7\|eukprot:XP_001840812.2 hypothetical protein CC1G_03041 [Coprinopsis cinerea okayama7\
MSERQSNRSNGSTSSLPSTSTRTTATSRSRPSTALHNSSHRQGQVLISGGQPPRYAIDLSQAPRDRHREICKAFKSEILALSQLYNSTLELFGALGRFIAMFAKVLLRRVWSDEETEEIRGIAEESGIPVHMVVAYNTFLDLFSGCVSGGVREGSVEGGRMLHFRGLDWDMEPLRDMIIQVEYVREGKVVARSVTYAGYVGSLTGVREGLSISLNYRARIISSKSVFAHRWHQLCLLLGFRQSISSQLRTLLLSPGPAPSLDHISSTFQSNHASPSYLTFCSPAEVMVIEKDLKSATVQRSDSFLAVTNHDAMMEEWDEGVWRTTVKESGLTDIGGIMEDSIQRKRCVAGMWKECSGGLVTAKGSGMSGKEGGVSVEDVKKWLRTYPVRNECTHFSCIMDPAGEGGGLVWAETYDESA